MTKVASVQKCLGGRCSLIEERARDEVNLCVFVYSGASRTGKLMKKDRAFSLNILTKEPLEEYREGFSSNVFIGGQLIS